MVSTTYYHCFFDSISSSSLYSLFSLPSCPSKIFPDNQQSTSLLFTSNKEQSKKENNPQEGSVSHDDKIGSVLLNLSFPLD